MSASVSASADASASQVSQGTVSASGQDTKSLKPLRPRPLPVAQAIDLDEQLSPAAIVALTLVIAIPVSMVAGALIATLAMRLMGS
jgi:hypothetical protein